MNQAEALYQLQQIDLSIVRGQKRIDEISQLLADNETLTAAQQSADAAAKVLSPARAKVRDLELEIQSTVQKSQSAEQQLYSGNVKNPKAMQELQQELEALKRRQSELEDRLLEAMEAADEAQSQVDSTQVQLAQSKQAWESAHTDLLTEQAQLQTQLEQLKSQRQNALKPIAPESLKLYTALKPRKSNQPVSPLQANSCTLCGIEQTMNVVQEARRGEKLTTCINCGRILMVKS